MSFDIRSHQNKPIVEYLKNSVALIVDHTGAGRTMIRKMFVEMGMSTNKVVISETYEEAVKKTEELKPQILVADYDLGNNCGLKLFEIQKRVLPDFTKAIFIVLSEKNSPTITAAAADADVDALLMKPFTYSSFQEKFIEIIQGKLVSSDYLTLIENGKALLNQQKLKEALAKFQEAKKLDDKPSKALFFEGETLRKLGKTNEAEASFREGLKYEPTHYKCLFGIFDIYQQDKNVDKAYEIAKTISKSYPIPPIRIPEFIHLSIRTHHLDDILDYYEIFLLIDPPDLKLVTYMAAAFVVCGHHYLRQRKTDQALDALKKARLLAKDNSRILKEIIEVLLEAKMLKEAENALAQMPEEIRTAPEIELLFFEHLRLQMTPVQVYCTQKKG